MDGFLSAKYYVYSFGFMMLETIVARKALVSIIRIRFVIISSSEPSACPWIELLVWCWQKKRLGVNCSSIGWNICNKWPYVGYSSLGVMPTTPAPKQPACLPLQARMNQKIQDPVPLMMYEFQIYRVDNILEDLEFIQKLTPWPSWSLHTLAGQRDHMWEFQFTCLVTF